MECESLSGRVLFDSGFSPYLFPCLTLWTRKVYAVTMNLRDIHFLIGWTYRHPRSRGGGNCQRLAKEMVENAAIPKVVNQINNKILENFSSFKDKCPCSAKTYNKDMNRIRDRWTKHKKTIESAMEKSKKAYNKKCVSK